MTNSPFGGFSFEDAAESMPAFTPADQAQPENDVPAAKESRRSKAAKPAKAPKAPKEPKQKKVKAPKLGAEVKANKMSESGRKFLLLSVAFVVVVAGGVMALLSASASTTESAWVLRAESKMSAGQIISPNDIVIEEIVLGSEDFQALGAISQAEAEDKAAELVGLTVVTEVFEGQQLRNGMFSEVELSVGSAIASDERLVSVSANVSGSLAGIISAGDVVDVVAVNSSGIAVLVADAAEVIAVSAPESAYRTAQQVQAANQTLNADDILPSDPIPGVYTMRVSATEAMPLAAADAAGTLYLIGRSADAASLSPVVDFMAYGCENVPADAPLPSVCERYLIDGSQNSGTVAG